MLPTKLLVLFSAIVLVSGQGISYYGTSNVRNQSRPPPHPLTLQSYQSQPDNAPRPVYVPPPPVAPAPEPTTMKNAVPVYPVSSNQYLPRPGPLQPAVQPAYPQPISAPPNLWSSGLYSRPTQPLEPSRPLPPLPPPTPVAIPLAPSTPEPEPEIIFAEPISSEPLPEENITPIRDTVSFEENRIPNQSEIALSPTTITPVSEMIVVVEPEKTQEPAPIETINRPSPYPEAPQIYNPTRQHIIGSPGSNFIQTTSRPPPRFPPLSPPPRNPPAPETQQPPYTVYPLPSIESEIPTLPPPQQPYIPNAPLQPSEEEPLPEISSPNLETSPPIIPDSDIEASSESNNARNPIELLPEPSPAPLPPPVEPIVPPFEPPAPSPAPISPPEEPIVPPIELPAPYPEPLYPTPAPPAPATQPPAPKPALIYPPQPIVPPIQPTPPRPAPLYPPQKPIVPPFERPAPSPMPLYPTPEPPPPSTQPPAPKPAPIYPVVPPIQPPAQRPAPLYPPKNPIVPPIERPAPSPIPQYPTPEPPAPSIQPPAPTPAPIYPAVPSIQPPGQRPAPIYPPPERIPTLKPTPLYPPKEPIVPPVQTPSPNPQPLYPSTNPANRPSASVSEPLKSKLLIGFTCSRGNGYYPIAEQCDSYVECQANQAWQNYCPDGLHFNPKAAYPDYPCAYPSEVKCTGSASKQVAQPTSECPRQYGFFSTPDGDCSKYVSCQEGQATLMNCPFGLVFNDALSSCDWPENVPQCNPQAFKDFTCPAPPLDSEGNPSDIIYKYKYGSHCKMYLACQRGHPRLLRCDSGMSFDEKSQACIDSDFVPECSMRT